MADTANVLSTLLSNEENDLVVTILGVKKQTKATAVIQMFHANPNRTQWTKFSTGIVCFVKDNTKRSYYIRLLDLGLKSITFEQEIYNQFTYKKHTQSFHSFPGDKFMVGMNFADENEALVFSQAVQSKLISHRNTIKKQNNAQQVPQVALPASNEPEDNSDHVGRVIKRAGAQKKKKKVKLSKADISAPSNFQHLAHVGIDANTGNFDVNNISSDWKQLLDTVGISHEQLKDKETAEFIYAFVEKRGGIEEANRQLEESKRKAAPPPPARKAPDHTQPPALPSPRVSSLSPLVRRAGAPPPPPSRSSVPANLALASPAPPPAPPTPPPPPPIGVPAPPPPPPPPPPPGPQSTKASHASNPPPTKKSPPVLPDARSDLLSSIRAGKQLKSVEGRETHAAAEPELEGLAGALARALASRNTVMQQSDDETEDDEEEEEEEEWSE